MARVGVLGGTGYAGSAIAAEAAARGHEVVAFARSVPPVGESLEGVRYVVGDAYDPAFAAEVVDGLDVLVLATKADTPDGVGLAAGVLPVLVPAAIAAGTRIGVMGGGATLLSEEGGTRRIDTPEVIPEKFRAEALQQSAVLDLLRASEPGLDWFYVSPGHAFGPWNPGERTGVFRIGGEVKLVDAEGRSDISGADLAIAFLDEIETPAHRRARFTVAY